MRTKLEHLTFTPSDILTSVEHPNTFVLMVDKEMYERRKRGDKSIPIADVVNSYDLLSYENPGKSGKLVRPSKREIEDAFGTTNDDELVELMLEKGVPHGFKQVV